MSISGYGATPNLNTAGSFGVLASSGVTNADSGTTINGSVGSAPASPAITGLTAVMVTGGTLYTSPNAVTAQAQVDATAAYTTAASAPCLPANNITGQDLGGLTLTAGASNVYCFSSSAGLTGTLTLIGGPSDVFIFKVGSSLTTATSSKVALTGVSACNVFWQVGSSATIGAASNFAGTILAKTSITLNGGTLLGRALANTGAVTISAKETVVSACSVNPVLVLSPGASSSVCGSGATTTETATLSANGSPLAGVAVIFKVTSGPGFGTYGPFVTDSFGGASFTVPSLGLLSAPDSIVAQYTDGSLNTWSSNTVTVSCVAPVLSDTTPPSINLLAVTPGPPKQVIFSVQDTGSGLNTVVVNISTNATITVPPIVHGTIDILGITATKIDQSQDAVIKFTVTDVAGNVTVFDPVFRTIAIAASRTGNLDSTFNHRRVNTATHTRGSTFDGIGPTEGTVLLQNGTPGVDRLVILVNGKAFEVLLANGETTRIDISSALFDGTNTVRIAAFGDPHSTVDVLISDGSK